MARLTLLLALIALSACVRPTERNVVTVQKCPAIEPVFECEDFCPFDAPLPSELDKVQEELLLCRDSDYCKSRKLEIWSDQWNDC